MPRSLNRTASPKTTILVTLAGCIGIVVLSAPRGVLLFTALIFLILIVVIRDFSVVRKLAYFSLPLIAPIMLVHSVINANFPITDWHLGVIPWRAGGFMFSVDISANLTLISVIGCWWLYNSRDDFTELLLALNIPMWTLLFLTQGTAIIGVVERKISTVLATQRASGNQVAGNIFIRIRAIPSILVPTVVGTLIEAEQRAEVSVTRGFAHNRPKSDETVMQFNTSESVEITAIGVSLLLALLV